MPAHIIHGDNFLTIRAITEIQRKAGLSDLMQSNQQQLHASSTDPQDVINACNTIAFLDNARLIIVEGVLTTAERGQGSPKGRTRRRRNQPRTGWDQLADAIPDMPDTTMLILIDEKVSASNSLLKELSQCCEVHAETAPTGAQLRRWISNNAKEKDATIRDDAVRTLEEVIGPDLWALDREIEKLSIYADGETIRKQDVEVMVPQARDANLFNALDAMTEGRTGSALQMMTRLMEDGSQPVQLMTMVNRQFRLIALAKDFIQRGTPQSEWGPAMGTNSDFVIRKSASQARHFQTHEIKRIYHLILEADLKIKQGRLDANIALEILVTQIATRQSAPKRWKDRNEWA